MQIGDLLNKIALSAGIADTDKDLIALLSNAAISTATISDDFATKIQSGLLTIEAAKNNPELKRYFTALALNSLDSELDGLIAEFEIPDDIKQELKNEKSSYKRAALLTKKVKELEAKKANAGVEDKSKLAKQIDELNGQLVNLKNTHNEEKAKLIDQHSTDRINWELNNYYNGYNYSLPITKEASIKVAKELVNDELTKLQLSIVNENNGLRLLTKEGTDHYANNQKVSLVDFIGKTLVTNKIISIEDPKKNQNQNQNTFNQNQNQNQNASAKSKAGDAVNAMLLEDINNVSKGK